MNIINDFRREYRFLSNYHVESNGLSVEHMFQAAKATNEHNHSYVLLAETPKQARGRGQSITLREDWELIKHSVMYNCLVEKFKDEKLAKLLLATGDAYLEEGNWWHDNEWGVCTCEKCHGKCQNNKLGLLLMRVRHEIRQKRI